jgi:5'-nucleotidase
MALRILITNDDGIDTVGIRLLASWAKQYGEVTVIAPKVEQSAKSHAIDIRGAFEIKKVPFMDGIEAYSVDSTPADCVRFGVIGLKRQYDLVLSGINRGVNVGDDIVYSGTCAAVFEAARLGMKGIAFSAFFEGQQEASKHFDKAYRYILDNDLLSQNLIYNVNIPNDPIGIRMTYQGSVYYSDEFVPDETAGENMYRQVGEQVFDAEPNDLNRDTVAIHAGYISVTPLMASRTNMEVYEKYKTE